MKSYKVRKPTQSKLTLFDGDHSMKFCGFGSECEVEWTKVDIVKETNVDINATQEYITMTSTIIYNPTFICRSLNQTMNCLKKMILNVSYIQQSYYCK